MSLGLVGEIVSVACLLVGSVFAVIGGIGILRLPDFFSRMHGGGITDTMGAGLILVGLSLQGGLSLVTAKLLLILVFLLITSPTSAHALAKAALTSGLQPFTGKERGKEEGGDALGKR